MRLGGGTRLHTLETVKQTQRYLCSSDYWKMSPRQKLSEAMHYRRLP